MTQFLCILILLLIASQEDKKWKEAPVPEECGLVWIAST